MSSRSRSRSLGRDERRPHKRPRQRSRSQQSRSPRRERDERSQYGFDPLPDVLECGIFWDYENVRVPRWSDVLDAVNRIRSEVERASRALGFKLHRVSERRLYFDSRKPTERGVDRAKLDLSGFTLVDCPTRNTKETLDKKIIVDACDIRPQTPQCGSECHPAVARVLGVAVHCTRR